MKCPACGHVDDRVLDTRIQKDGTSIRRRRECLKCRSRFTTQEYLIQEFPLVVKKDGRREAFDKDKLLRGLQAACQKRPIPRNVLEQTVEKISKWALELNDREIGSSLIGLQIMKHLRDIDDVAYIRFASVYRTFKDVHEFVETLETEIPTPGKDLNV